MKGHTIRAVAVAILLLGMVFVRTARAQDRGPSTPEERARAVKIAHSLEEDPLAKDASEKRAWVIQWITRIPDITVYVCGEYFGKLPDTPHGYATDITWQMTISSTAFMIEHPDRAKDEQAVALAGLQAALKAYQAILSQEPSARWPYVDHLVRLRDQGKLDDYVSDTRLKCSQDEEDPDPGTMRAQAD